MSGRKAAIRNIITQGVLDAMNSPEMQETLKSSKYRCVSCGNPVPNSKNGYCISCRMDKRQFHVNYLRKPKPKKTDEDEDYPYDYDEDEDRSSFRSYRK